jgi:hypothetical protein
MAFRLTTLLGSALVLVACSSGKSSASEDASSSAGEDVGNLADEQAGADADSAHADDLDTMDPNSAQSEADEESGNSESRQSDGKPVDAADSGELDPVDLTDSSDEAAGATDQLAEDSSVEKDTPPAEMTDESVTVEAEEEEAVEPESGQESSDEFVVEEDTELVLDPEDTADDCEKGAPGCECESVIFSVGTRASCDMQLLPDVEVDGTGFLHVSDGDHMIFAMNRWGSGHVIGWCDSDSAVQMINSFPGWDYLAQTESPRIAAMGSHWGCELNVSYPFWANQMPEEYVGNPEKLAEDWDVIMLCGFHVGVDPDGVTTPVNREEGWPDDWKPTLTSFVKDYGKGLFVVMDYFGTVVKDYDLTHVNDIVGDAGFEFLPHELEWGDASASVALECVPDVPRRVR